MQALKEGSVIKKGEVPDFEQVKDKALELLSMRMHSESELRNKLKMRGASEVDIDDTMDFLKECGFVNDNEFARMYAEELCENKRYGRARIKSELYKKGISPDIISGIIDDIESDPDELRGLVENKLGGDFSKKNTDKAIRYFIYRGYSFSEILSCINELRDECGENNCGEEEYC